MDNSIYKPPQSDLDKDKKSRPPIFVSGWLNLFATEILVSFFVSTALLVSFILDLEKYNPLRKCTAWDLSCLTTLQQLDLARSFLLTPLVMLVGLIAFFKFIRRKKSAITWCYTLIAICFVRAILHLWAFMVLLKLKQVIFFAAIPMAICLIEVSYLQQSKRVKKTFKK
jgi:hypothetical protein